jgi:glutathione S-transferase
MTVELYFFQPLGTNSGRVYLTLLEKGVSFVEHELQGRNFEHLQPAYLQINPRGQVPALVHDGRVYTEGMTINEYLDESCDGPPLRPADPLERWRMRAWCRYAENDLGRSLMMIHWNRIVPTFIGARDMQEVDALLARVPDPDRRRSWRSAFEQKTPPAVLEESQRRTRAGLSRVEQLLRTQPWLAGASYSLADIDFLNFCAMIMTMWMGELISEQTTPAFVDWLGRVNERAAVREMRQRRSRLPPP